MGDLTFSTFLEYTALFLISIVDIDGLHELLFPLPDLKGFFISFTFLVLWCNVGLESSSGRSNARTVGIRSRCRVYKHV